MSMELTDALGEKRKFSSQNSFKAFAKKEIKFWRDMELSHPKQEHMYYLSGKPPGASLADILKSVTKLEVLLQKISGKKAYEHTPELTKLKDDIRARWIFRDSEFTKKWLTLFARNPEDGDDFFYTAIEKTPRIGVHAANEFILKKINLDSRIPPKTLIQEHIDELNLALDETNTLKERILRSATTQADLLRQQRVEQDDHWKKSLAHLEDTYKERLRLQGPANYWEDKAKVHWVRGAVFFGLLLGILLAAAIALSIFFSIWLAGDKTPVSLNHIEGLLIFISLLSTLAFSSRVLSRMAFSEFHLQRDAEERLQLTHLYLSLSNETSLENDARVIILQSLFSRAETGLLVNESGPTMPGITDLLSALKKSA